MGSSIYGCLLYRVLAPTKNREHCSQTALSNASIVSTLEGKIVQVFVLCMLLIALCPVHSLVITLARSTSFQALPAHEHPSVAIPVTVQTSRCIEVIEYHLVVEEDGGFRDVILDLGFLSSSSSPPCQRTCASWGKRQPPVIAIPGLRSEM